LKRTRRIEVIRYSRRLTVIQGEPAAAVMADEQQPGDLILDVLAGIPPAPERVNCDGSAPDETVADHPPRRRSLVRLGELLRLRGRT